MHWLSLSSHLSSAGLGLVVEVVDIGGDSLLGNNVLMGAGVDRGCCSKFSNWLRIRESSSTISSLGRGGVALVGWKSSSSLSVE